MGKKKMKTTEVRAAREDEAVAAGLMTKTAVCIPARDAVAMARTSRISTTLVVTMEETGGMAASRVMDMTSMDARVPAIIQEEALVVCVEKTVATAAWVHLM